MTEEEAKTKWCPFARDSNTAGNRARYGAAHDLATEGVDDLYVAEAAAEFPCIASACMAWRTYDAGLSRLELEARVKNPDAIWHVQRAMIDSPRDGGYCGLAGAPQ